MTSAIYIPNFLFLFFKVYQDLHRMLARDDDISFKRSCEQMIWDMKECLKH